MELDKERARGFGAYLRGLRMSRQWSLRDVEEKTGGEISNPYLSQIERGERGVPSMSLIDKLAKAFGIPIETLLKEAGYVGQETSAKAEAHHVFRGYEKLSPKRRELLADFLKLLEKQERQDKQGS